MFLFMDTNFILTFYTYFLRSETGKTIKAFQIIHIKHNLGNCANS